MSEREKVMRTLIQQQMLKDEVDKEVATLEQSLLESQTNQETLEQELKAIREATLREKAATMSELEEEHEQVAALAIKVVRAAERRRAVHSAVLNVEAELREAEKALMGERVAVAAEENDHWPSSLLDSMSARIAAALVAHGEPMGTVERVTAMLIEMETVIPSPLHPTAFDSLSVP